MGVLIELSIYLLFSVNNKLVILNISTNWKKNENETWIFRWKGSRKKLSDKKYHHICKMLNYHYYSNFFIMSN